MINKKILSHCKKQLQKHENYRQFLIRISNNKDHFVVSNVDTLEEEKKYYKKLKRNGSIKLVDFIQMDRTDTISTYEINRKRFNLEIEKYNKLILKINNVIEFILNGKELDKESREYYQNVRKLKSR